MLEFSGDLLGVFLAQYSHFLFLRRCLVHINWAIILQEDHIGGWASNHLFNNMHQRNIYFFLFAHHIM